MYLMTFFFFRFCIIFLLILGEYDPDILLTGLLSFISTYIFKTYNFILIDFDSGVKYEADVWLTGEIHSVCPAQLSSWFAVFSMCSQIWKVPGGTLWTLCTCGQSLRVHAPLSSAVSCDPAAAGSFVWYYTTINSCVYFSQRVSQMSQPRALMTFTALIRIPADCSAKQP